MLDLSSTDFYLAVPSLQQSEFESFTTRLFDDWEAHVAQTLVLPDYSLLLQVEEGSIKGVGKIAAALGALYIGIGQYGDFISGLQQIRSQVSGVGDFLAERAYTPFSSSAAKPKIRRHGGTLAQLQRVFVQVQRHELSVEEAMREAEGILGEECASAPEFMSSLQEALRETPRYPKQLPLPFEIAPMDSLPAEGKEEHSPRSSRPRPIHPPPLQLRVEVWRESKDGKRRVRVTQL